MLANATPSGEALASRVAAEVRAEMGRQGLSQQALAGMLGWSQARVSRRLAVAGPRAALTLAEVTSIAEVLNVPVATLLPASERAA